MSKAKVFDDIYQELIIFNRNLSKDNAEGKNKLEVVEKYVHKLYIIKGKVLEVDKFYKVTKIRNMNE